MKTWMRLFASGLLTFGSLVEAQDLTFEVKETVVSLNVTETEIALNDETVLCSRADYSGDFLKVLIPQLKEITLLDHRNDGAGAPCVAAGICKSELFPDGLERASILNPDKPTENVKINTRLVRISEIDHAKKVCKVTLREEIALDIRGVPFSHARFATLGLRNYLDCI